MSHKWCPKCETHKFSTKDFWYKDSHTNDGFSGHCKACRSSANKERLKIPEKRKKLMEGIKRWRTGAGKEKYTAYRREYEKSEKRIEWRKSRYFPTEGKERVKTLEEAILELEKDKEARKNNV